MNYVGLALPSDYNHNISEVVVYNVYFVEVL